MAKLKKDLDLKFNATSQYATMKKMLHTKNEQLKELRARLGISGGDDDELL